MDALDERFRMFSGGDEDEELDVSVGVGPFAGALVASVSPGLEGSPSPSPPPPPPFPRVGIMHPAVLSSSSPPGENDALSPPPPPPRALRTGWSASPAAGGVELGPGFDAAEFMRSMEEDQAASPAPRQSMPAAFYSPHSLSSRSTFRSSATDTSGSDEPSGTPPRAPVVVASNGVHHSRPFAGGNTADASSAHSSIDSDEEVGDEQPMQQQVPSVQHSLGSLSVGTRDRILEASAVLSAGWDADLSQGPSLRGEAIGAGVDAERDWFSPSSSPPAVLVSPLAGDAAASAAAEAGTGVQSAAAAASAAYESASAQAVALLSHPHVQTLMSSARLSLEYASSSLDGAMEVGARVGADLLTHVVPAVVAAARTTAALSADTLATSVLPSVSAAVASTYEQVSSVALPTALMQAKAVQRWLQQRVHLAPVRPMQLASAGGSGHGGHGGGAGPGGEDLQSYISFIEAALKQEEAAEAAAAHAARQSALPGGTGPSVPSVPAGAAPADGSAGFLSGQRVLLFDNHFSLLTEREKSKLRRFLADMKRQVRLQQQQETERKSRAEQEQQQQWQQQAHVQPHSAYVSPAASHVDHWSASPVATSSPPTSSGSSEPLGQHASVSPYLPLHPMHPVASAALVQPPLPLRRPAPPSYDPFDVYSERKEQGQLQQPQQPPMLQVEWDSRQASPREQHEAFLQQHHPQLQQHHLHQQRLPQQVYQQTPVAAVGYSPVQLRSAPPAAQHEPDSTAPFVLSEATVAPSAHTSRRSSKSRAADTSPFSEGQLLQTMADPHPAQSTHVQPPFQPFSQSQAPRSFSHASRSRSSSGALSARQSPSPFSSGALPPRSVLASFASTPVSVGPGAPNGFGAAGADQAGDQSDSEEEEEEADEADQLAAAPFVPAAFAPSSLPSLASLPPLPLSVGDGSDFPAADFSDSASDSSGPDDLDDALAAAGAAGAAASSSTSSSSSSFDAPDSGSDSARFRIEPGTVSSYFAPVAAGQAVGSAGADEDSFARVAAISAHGCSAVWPDLQFSAPQSAEPDGPCGHDALQQEPPQSTEYLP